MKGLEHITWARLWGFVPSISFQWPLFLWLLLLVPLLVAVYILLLYRRKKTAFRYSNLALIKEASE
jgi:Ca-activated chloride channel family protein